MDTGEEKGLKHAPLNLSIRTGPDPSNHRKKASRVWGIAFEQRAFCCKSISSMVKTQINFVLGGLTASV
jgi:hypothetical protein